MSQNTLLELDALIADRERLRAECEQLANLRVERQEYEAMKRGKDEALAHYSRVREECARLKSALEGAQAAFGLEHKIAIEAQEELAEARRDAESRDAAGHTLLELRALEKDAELWRAMAPRLAETKRDAERLREALQRYGYHNDDCDYMRDEMPCTCGFAALKDAP